MANDKSNEVQSGMTIREDAMGAREMMRVAEVQAAATAAMVKAEVNARFELALMRPRNWMDVRTTMLAACDRPRFADAAIYSVKRGKKQDPQTGQWVDNYIEGASIRFIEEAIRSMTNVMPDVRVLVEDDAKRIVRVTMTDLENNITMSEEFVLSKVTEKRRVRDGDEVIGERVNSSGHRVFQVVARDDEMTTKQAAMVSKAIRNLGKRLLPSDIHDECLERCYKTIDTRDAQDPSAAKKRMVDAFAAVGVTAAQIEAHIGMPIALAPPAKLRPLKGILQAIEEGATWEQATEQPDAGEGVEAPKTQADRLRDMTAAKASEAMTATSTPATSSEPAKPAETAPASVEKPKGKGGKAKAEKAAEAPAKDAETAAPEAAPAHPGDGVVKLLADLYERSEKALAGPLPNEERMTAINAFRLPFRAWRIDSTKAADLDTAWKAADPAKRALEAHEAERTAPPKRPDPAALIKALEARGVVVTLPILARWSGKDQCDADAWLAKGGHEAEAPSFLHPYFPRREEPAEADAPPPDDEFEGFGEEPPAELSPLDSFRASIDALALTTDGFDAFKKAAPKDARWAAMSQDEKKAALAHFNARKALITK